MNRPFHLAALFLLCIAAAWPGLSEEPDTGEVFDTPIYKAFPSPNGRWIMSLQVGRAIGNCDYNRAQLLAGKSQKVRCELKGRMGEDSEGAGGYGGGFGWFDAPPVYWSKDSRYVAVMCHDHRGGDIDVVRCRSGRVRTCTMPDVVLPRPRPDFDAGQLWHEFLRPERWTKGDLLVANLSGDIRNYRKMPQRPGAEPHLDYEYRVWIKFNAAGVGKVVAIKKLHLGYRYVTD